MYFVLEFVLVPLIKPGSEIVGSGSMQKHLLCEFIKVLAKSIHE